MSFRNRLPQAPALPPPPRIPAPKEVVSKVTNDAADLVRDAESAIRDGPLSFVEKGLRKVGGLLP